jgi:hypothetical protein
MDLTLARSTGQKLHARRTKLEAQVDEVRSQLRELAEGLLLDGVPPREVHAITGWSPAQVRAIARQIGVGPATSGRPPTRAGGAV